MRISDWSSDVFSSDLAQGVQVRKFVERIILRRLVCDRGVRAGVKVAFTRQGAPISRATIGGGLSAPTPGISFRVADGSGTLSCAVPVGGGSGTVILSGYGNETGLFAGSRVEHISAEPKRVV